MCDAENIDLGYNYKMLDIMAVDLVYVSICRMSLPLDSSIRSQVCINGSQ